jgi:hypothetical protein
MGPAVELTQGVADLLQCGFQLLHILAYVTSLDQLSLKIELRDAQRQRFFKSDHLLFQLFNPFVIIGLSEFVEVAASL